MFSITKRFFELPEQTLHTILSSEASGDTTELTWMEKFFDDVHELILQLETKLQVSSYITKNKAIKLIT